ncbi:MAG: hypothetical protein IKV79_01560 [Oscillospiraceae bacterium]|nr:hypothetical protein [Oscillospiraceae bacterium]
MRKKQYLLLPLAALIILLLGSCNYSGGEKDGSNNPDFVARAEPWAGLDAREFYNESTGCTLCLGEEGAFALYAPGLSLEGTYTATEQALSLVGGGEEATAYPSGGGYVLSGMGGLFLPMESKDSFTEMGVLRAGDREYAEETGGIYRLSDYSLRLALQYPETMSAPENLISDAVVVWDGESGYVVGRNVTADYDEDAEEFMESYMESAALSDFRQLYGEKGEFDSLEMLNEGISGRLASAEGIILGGGERVYVKCIMYTSTYSDGTENYICKCFFTLEGDTEAFNALTSSVVNMTAVRRR